MTVFVGLNPFFIRAFGSTRKGAQTSGTSCVLIPFSSGHSVQPQRGLQMAGRGGLNPFFIRAFGSTFYDDAIASGVLS